MTLDYYTREKLAYCHIADYQNFAEGVHTVVLAEEKRPSEDQSMSNRWFARVLHSFAPGHIPNASTLRRL